MRYKHTKARVALAPMLIVAALAALPAMAQATSFVKWGAGPNPTAPYAPGTYHVAAVGSLNVSAPNGTLTAQCNVYAGGTVTDPSEPPNGVGTGSITGFWQNGAAYPSTPCTAGGIGGAGCTAGIDAETNGTPAFTSTLPWATTLGLSGSTFTNSVTKPSFLLTFVGKCAAGGISFKMTPVGSGWTTTHLENNTTAEEGHSKECSGTTPNTVTELFAGGMSDGFEELSVSGSLQIWKVANAVTKTSTAQGCSSLGVLNTSL